MQKNAPDVFKNIISTIIKQDWDALFFNHQKDHFLLELLSYGTIEFFLPVTIVIIPDVLVTNLITKLC